MKEASGELNMTVITIVAIAAVAAFFYAFVWPAIQRSVVRGQCASEWGVESSDVTATRNGNNCFTCNGPGGETMQVGEGCGN